MIAPLGLWIWRSISSFPIARLRWAKLKLAEYRNSLHPFAENLLALRIESMPRNQRYLATSCAPSRATCLSPTRLVEFPSESRRFHCFSSCSRQFTSPSVTPFLGPGIALRFFASLAYFHLS